MFFPAKARMAVAGLVVAGGAVAAAALGPAGPAVGQASPPTQLQIQVNSSASLVAKGTGVDVSVTASCPATTQQILSAGLSVILTERVGVAAAVGSGGTSSINCTGAAQSFDLLVTPDVGSVAFKQGNALANAQINVCTLGFPPSPPSCVSAQVQPTIKITK